MAGIFRNFLEREFHELEAADPRMKSRNKSRFVLILSAIPIVPISVLLLIVTLLSWDAASHFDKNIWTIVLLHPFLACLCLMVGMAVHKQAQYWVAMIIGAGPQACSFLVFWFMYFRWAFS